MMEHEAPKSPKGTPPTHARMDDLVGPEMALDLVLVLVLLVEDLVLPRLPTGHDPHIRGNFNSKWPPKENNKTIVKIIK